jgi:hypothetical protein
MSDAAEDHIKRAAGDEGGADHADAREEADRPLAPLELGRVDMQGAGEEEEGQHAVEERAVELDGIDRALGVPVCVEPKLAQRDDAERQGEREEQQRDARGLADVAVVDPAEDRSQRDHRGRGA